MPKSVLLCPPTYFDVIDMKNPYMLGDYPVDKSKAREQWENLRAALESAGVKVKTIDPLPGLEDMVFSANQVFVGHQEKIGKFIVPSRMRHASRQQEVAAYVEWFRKHGYEVIQIDFGDEYLEGGGDLIWHPGVARVYAGFGFRSTLGGIQRFAKAMQRLGIKVVPLELSDPSFYHLDTCFCPLNHEAVLVYPAAFAKDSLAVLEGYWHRLHEIAESEALGFMANGIVAGNTYLTPRLTPSLEKILERENLEPVIVDTSEFEKSGGSCYCMKNFLE